MIRVFRTGAHAHRTPLSYPALAALFERDITHVERPEEADLYVFAHSLDIRAAPEELVRDWRRRRRPVVLLSEEPFWDTIWTREPLKRQIYLDTAWGALPVVQLNHATSAIFRFARIPYYLLTNHRFVNAYRYRFRRNAARSASEWLEDFRTRAQDTVFMFERRPEAFHDVRWPKADIIGLCAWRTRLAEAAEGAERLGASWQGGQTRWQLSDWHMDKLIRLDRRARSLAAFENTHQPDYVTEKFFDAMACGVRPLYYADSRHRIGEFGVPDAAWLNLAGLTATEAAARLETPFLTHDFVDAWCEGQAALARLFGDTGIVLAERERLQKAVLGEFGVILEQGART